MAKRVVIGVTGGLATGKTVVADMFAAKGAVKIDADRIAHEILEEDSSVRREVAARYGSRVMTDGKIDRKKLAEIVFKDAGELAALSGLMHPEIIRRIARAIAARAEGVIVLEAPLLLEAGRADMVDILVVVTAGRETQVKRAMDRGMSREEAESVIDAQMPLSEKVKLADHVIDNDGDMEKTKEGVDRIWQNV